MTTMLRLNKLAQFIQGSKRVRILQLYQRRREPTEPDGRDREPQHQCLFGHPPFAWSWRARIRPAALRYLVIHTRTAGYWYKLGARAGE